MTLIITGVARTPTRPLPTRGAVCSIPTCRSADPLSPIVSLERSTLRNACLIDGQIQRIHHVAPLLDFVVEHHLGLRLRCQDRVKTNRSELRLDLLTLDHVVDRLVQRCENPRLDCCRRE